MLFTVEREKLLEAVLKLQSVVGSKTSMPVLEGILISAEQGKITLVSYNLEMGMKKEIYAKCEQEGDIVINARLLADILRRMNGLQVEISADDRLNCNIKCGEATLILWVWQQQISLKFLPFHKTTVLKLKQNF